MYSKYKSQVNTLSPVAIRLGQSQVHAPDHNTWGVVTCDTCKIEFAIGPNRIHGARIGEREQQLIQILFAVKFVNRRPPHHSFDCDGWPERWHAQRIAVLKTLQISPNAMQQKIVGINLFEQNLPAIMLDTSQRPARCHSTGRKKCIQRRRKRTHVVCPRCSDLSNYINAHASKPKQRDVYGNVAKLRSHHTLH